jgi:hypothetical protein
MKLLEREIRSKLQLEIDRMHTEITNAGQYENEKRMER